MSPRASLTDSAVPHARLRVVVLLAALVFLAIALASARTREPFVDEAWFSMPAWNLAVHGSFGTPLIEPSASPLPGLNVKLTDIRSHTYWYLPLPIVVESAWFRVLGFSIFTLRLFTTLWALVLLAAWYLVVERLSGSALIALVALAFTAADPVFLQRSGFGRFDLMAGALGFCGLAAYLTLRQRSLPKALLAGHTFVVAAGMTHPTGGILAFPALVCLILYFDRRRLRWSFLPLVAVPYLVAAAGMAVYILQDLPAFKDQFFGITGNRLAGATSPLSLIPREIRRYLDVYGLNPEGSAISRLKLAIFAVYVAAAAFLCGKAAVRKHYRGLLILAAAYIGSLTVFDDFKQQWYVVYNVPIFAAILAVALFQIPRPQRRWAAAAIAALCLMDVASVVRLAVGDTYDHVYRPMIAYLNSHTGPHSLIMASSEIGFNYGFDRNLIDDIRLGCRSGKTPDLVVMETRYRYAFNYFRTTEPATAQCIAQFFKTASPPVAFGSEYAVYSRLSAGR